MKIQHLWLAILPVVMGYPSGAPPTTCKSMFPGHRADAQSNAAPFSVMSARSHVAPGETLRLMINSPQDIGFTGFILQARTPSSGEEAFGTFTSFPDWAKALDCGDGKQNAVTHKNSTMKKSLDFEWKAPDDYEGPVMFNATVLQDFSTFWTGVVSEQVEVSKREVDHSAQSVGISTTRSPVPTSRSTTTPAYIPEVVQRQAQSEDPIYKDCNSKKSCFGIPEGCIDEEACTAIVAIFVEGSRYYFEMKSKGAVYVAVGLSDDRNMGDDSVIECVNDNRGNNKVNAYMSWNTPNKNNYRLRPQQQNAISLVSSSFVDGAIYCRVLRDTVTNVENNQFDLANNKYYVLLAAGSGLKDNGSRVGFHDVAYDRTAEPVFASEIVTFVAASKLLLRLHGAFMIAAWIGFASVGIIFARYFKQTWVGKQMCGKDQWFVWHRFFMLLTWSLTIAGFVIIFVELRDWSKEDNPHAIIGTVTTVLAFLQPIGALFRPHPNSRRRPIFNWLHWLVGNSAFILAIVAIFFAINLSKAQLPDWMNWILVAYVAFHVIMHLILSIANCASERSNSSRIDSFPMKDMASSRSPLHPGDRKIDAPFSGLRKFFLAVYLVIIIPLTVALVVIVACAPIESTWEKFQNKITGN